MHAWAFNQNLRVKYRGDNKAVLAIFFNILGTVLHFSKMLNSIESKLQKKN